MNVPVISLHNPWSEAIFRDDGYGNSLKPHETRHWPTPVRGRVFIHAAKRPLAQVLRECPSLADSMLVAGIHEYDLFYGAIIGSVVITDCIPTDHISLPAWQAAWGNYSLGRYAWKLRDPIKLERPYFVTGRQGWFRVDSDLLCLDPFHSRMLEPLEQQTSLRL